MDQVRTWASEADRPRAAFYSAREEPDEKDAGGVRRGKKVTNVTLMEEIEMLKAQLGSLMMDAANVQRDAHPATPTAELLAGTSLAGPRIPAVSEGIANGPYSTGRPCSDHWSTTNNPAVCSEGHPEEAALHHYEGGRAQASAGSSSRSGTWHPCLGISPAEHGDHSIGGPSDEQLLNAVGRKQRCPTTRPDDERSGLGEIQLFPTVPAAAPQKDAAIETCPPRKIADIARASSRAQTGPLPEGRENTEKYLKDPEGFDGLGTSRTDCHPVFGAKLQGVHRRAEHGAGKIRAGPLFSGSPTCAFC